MKKKKRKIVKRKTVKRKMTKKLWKFVKAKRLGHK